MTHPIPGLDYTRVSEDAAILCRRQDFPRAVNVLQRRSPEHRRWRQAFRHVSVSAARTLEGARRRWAAEAVRDLVSNAVGNVWLRSELALDLHVTAQDFTIDDVLPEWTPREVWHLADSEGLPMEYVVNVTSLPRSIDASIDTARVVLDFRRTSIAHREEIVRISRSLPRPGAEGEGTAGAEPEVDLALARAQMHAQRDAAERWRRLAQRLLLLPPSVDAAGS